MGESYQIHDATLAATGLNCAQRQRGDKALAPITHPGKLNTGYDIFFLLFRSRGGIRRRCSQRIFSPTLSSSNPQSLDGYKAQAEAAQLAYKKVCLDLLARDGRITLTAQFTTARSARVAVARETNNVADLTVQQLRRELGPEAFAQLDTFAKKHLEPATRAHVQGVSTQEVAR